MGRVLSNCCTIATALSAWTALASARTAARAGGAGVAGAGGARRTFAPVAYTYGPPPGAAAAAGASGGAALTGATSLGSQGFEVDPFASDNEGGRTPGQKRTRRRVTVETRDAEGRPYTQAEIRRMKR